MKILNQTGAMAALAIVLIALVLLLRGGVVAGNYQDGPRKGSLTITTGQR